MSGDWLALFICLMKKYNLSIDLSKFKPQIAAKLIEELERKGFYTNGIITCSEEQGGEVRGIIDNYLLMNNDGAH